MADRRVNAHDWAFGPNDRFTITGMHLDRLEWPWSEREAWLVRDNVAIARDPGPPDGDHFAGFVGFYDSRKAARAAARRVMREDTLPMPEAGL